MADDSEDSILLDEISRRILLLLSTGNKLGFDVIEHIVGSSANAARHGVNVLEHKYHFITKDGNNNFQLTESGVDYLRTHLGIPAKKPESTSKGKQGTSKAAGYTFSSVIDAIIWGLWASPPIAFFVLSYLVYLGSLHLMLKVLAIIALGVFLVIYLKWGIVPVMEGNKLVLFRWGKYIGTKGPGPVLVVPFFYTTETVDVRVKEQEIPHQTCITQDNVQIDIDFVYYWRIEIPEWSLTKVANPQQSIQLLATGILRAVIAKFTFTDVQKNRQTINDKLKEEIDVIIREWGVNVTSIEIREVKASPEIVKAMEQARTAQWNRETMGILASGEAEALNALRQAAYDLDQNTLNLKYFEVLRKLGEGQATKYIFPMEFSNLVDSWIRKKGDPGAEKNDDSSQFTRQTPEVPVSREPERGSGDRGGAEGGKGTREGGTFQSSIPRIELNVPIDITMSNETRSLVSSQMETPAGGINGNWSLVLPVGRPAPHGGTHPSGKGRVGNVEELTLPWLPALLNPEAQADPNGKGYVVHSSEEVPITISHITIEGQVYAIHLIKKTAVGIQRLTKLVSSRKYGWMKVRGDSMKDFNPRIEEGDYVLFYDLQPSFQEDTYTQHDKQGILPDDNIVIVRRIDKLTNEVLLLVKSYRKSENLLYSYNNEKKYSPLELCQECQVIGVVIAVAKPEKRQETTE